MRSLGRKPWTLLAVLALAYPWVLGAALLVHLAGHDHGRLGHDQPDVIELIVHGHHHDPGTPDHQHSLTVSAPLLASAKRAVVPTLPANGLAEVATTISPLWYRCALGVFGPSPPSQLHASAVLRI